MNTNMKDQGTVEQNHLNILNKLKLYWIENIEKAGFYWAFNAKTDVNEVQYVLAQSFYILGDYLHEILRMVSFLYVVLLLPIFYFVLKISWMKWTSRYFFLPHPEAIPWLGASLSIPREPHMVFKFMCDTASKCDNLYCVWVGPLPVIMASRVEYVKAVLSSQILIKKSSLYSFVIDWLGTGLLTSFGQKWKTRRRLITPSFHFGILMNFTDIFEEQAKKLCFKLRAAADTGKAIDIQIPVSLAKLDVICETSMGVQINAQDSPDLEYVKSICKFNSKIQERQKNPFTWIEFLYKLTPSGKEYYKLLDSLHNFTINVINESIERRKDVSDGGSNVKGKKMFLDMLLDLYDKGEIDVEGIREEVDTFMFEGHDTTSVGLSWTLYELSHHPDIQNKLYEEIKNADLDLDIVDRVKSMRYLDCVLKEGLRLHPPVPVFGRSIKDDVVIDNNVIPKGTEIAISTYDLHRNPRYWTDPHSFNPDRFADEEKRDPFCYVPFSAGPRNCIGQRFAVLEEKIFLYYLLSMYELKGTQPYEDVKSCIEIIHKSENGLYIEFLSR